MSTIVARAKIAEQAERHEDMVGLMKMRVEKDEPLSSEERNLLSVAYENVVGARRSAWRVISSIEQTTSEDTRRSLAGSYRRQIESELKDICGEVIALLDRYLIKAAQSAQEQAQAQADCTSDDAAAVQSLVFYLKMKGDYHRYLTEVTQGASRDSYAKCAEEAYSKATEAAADLSTTHPVRIGLALNYSVFLYEIKLAVDEARRLAKKAIDDATASLDYMHEDGCKDSHLILELLQDNLTLWNSEDAAD